MEAVADALPIYQRTKVYSVHVVGSSSWTSTGQGGLPEYGDERIVKAIPGKAFIADGRRFATIRAASISAMRSYAHGDTEQLDGRRFTSASAWWDKGAEPAGLDHGGSWNRRV